MKNCSLEGVVPSTDGQTSEMNSIAALPEGNHSDVGTNEMPMISEDYTVILQFLQQVLQMNKIQFDDHAGPSQDALEEQA